MKKVVGIVAVALLIVVAAWFVLGRNDKKSNQAAQTIQSESSAGSSFDKAQPNKAELVIGSASAPLSIVEYADFKCPTCNRFFRGAYPEIQKNYIETGKAKIVFRNLPFIAEDSRTAAEGAYCANDQGKFRQYHDLLFNQIWDEYYGAGKVAEGEAASVFAPEQLKQLVVSIGIDTGQFDECLKTSKYKDAVTSDLAASERDGATGTPTFIIGNQKIVGAQTFSFYDKLIQAVSR